MASESLTAEGLARILGDWSSGSGPLYGRLHEALAAAVDRSELRHGTVLPTERSLAERLAVSRTTVVRAYGDLKRAGLLASRQGRGTWVTGGAVAPAGGSEQRPPFTAGLLGNLLDEDDAIDMATSCPPMSEGVRRIVGEIEGRELVEDVRGVGYVPAGLPELQVRCAEALERDGLRCDLSEIIVTVGAMQAVVLSAVALGAPGEAVLVEEAAFPAALDAFRAVGLRPQAVPLRGGAVDVDALRKRIERVRPRLIYLTPVFQNPTGGALSPTQAERIARIAAETGVPVVEDRTMRFVELDDERPPAPIASHSDTAPIVTIHSLSKVLWAGLRTGWIRAPRRIAERLVRAKLLMDMGSPVLGQSIAVRVMPELERAIEERRALQRSSYRALTDAMAEHLPDWTYEPPAGGPVILARVPGRDTREIAELARREGVKMLPGPAMSAHGDLSDHVRLPFVHPPAVVEEAVRRIAAVSERARPAHARATEVVV